MKHHQGLGLLRCIFAPFSSSESQFLAYYLHISGRRGILHVSLQENCSSIIIPDFVQSSVPFVLLKKKMRWPYISIHLGFSIACSWPELRIQPWIEAVKPLGLQLMPFPFLLACRTTAWQKDSTEAWRYWPTLSQFHCRMCQWQRESSVLVTRYTHFWYLVFSLGYF